MLTPRSTLIRRIAAALDASPSRIPVLVGGCGSGRTTVLHQLRDRIGRNTAQYIDVERTATTPERFLRAVTGASPFPGVDTAPTTTPRAAFDQALEFLARARAGAAEPATLLLDEFLELRTFESFPGLRRVLHDLIDGLGTSGNRFVLTSRYMARTLRLLRDRSARFEVIHIPPVTAEDTLDMLGLPGVAAADTEFVARGGRAAVQPNPEAQHRVGEAVTLLSRDDQVDVLQPRQVVLGGAWCTAKAEGDLGEGERFLLGKHVEDCLQRAVAARAVEAQLVTEAARVRQGASRRQQRSQRAHRIVSTARVHDRRHLRNQSRVCRAAV